MIESLRNAQERSKAPRGALLRARKQRVDGVATGRLGFFVVIAHESRNDGTILPAQAGNVSVEYEVFTVLVMAAVTDDVTEIVEKRAGFEEHARVLRQMMNGLELVEEHERHPPDVFGVLLVVTGGREAPCEAARAGKHLA